MTIADVTGFHGCISASSWQNRSSVSITAFVPSLPASAEVGDPSATRTVYVTVVLLIALGVALVALTVWLVRRTRPDPQLLAPLEEMETRAWRKQDPAAQRRALDASRPAGARPVRREAAEPSVDTDFAASRPVVSFDDLADGPSPSDRVDHDLEFDDAEFDDDVVIAESLADADADADADTAGDAEAENDVAATGDLDVSGELDVSAEVDTAADEGDGARADDFGTDDDGADSPVQVSSQIADAADRPDVEVENDQTETTRVPADSEGDVDTSSVNGTSPATEIDGADEDETKLTATRPRRLRRFRRT